MRLIADSGIVSLIPAWSHTSVEIDHEIFSTVIIIQEELVLEEYWVLMESRIPLKPVLGSVRIVGLSISSH